MTEVYDIGGGSGGGLDFNQEGIPNQAQAVGVLYDTETVINSLTCPIGKEYMVYKVETLANLDTQFYLYRDSNKLTGFKSSASDRSPPRSYNPGIKLTAGEIFTVRAVAKQPAKTGNYDTTVWYIEQDVV